jgi:hypothetical protein
VAGGSSEVDNPIVVAFVDSLGVSLTTTGTLSVYAAGQNPALDPDPLLTRQVTNATSIQLSSRELTQGLDSAGTFNVLLIGENDSVGALLQNLSYHPSKGRFSLDSVTVSKVKVPVVPLVQYNASLTTPVDTGLVRVFIPGSPFQTVVVDSSFTIDGVPKGNFTLHLLGGDGSERTLKPVLDNSGSGNHHEIDSAIPPIERPVQPTPTQPLTVFAGNDLVISFTSNDGGGDDEARVSVFGSVTGVAADDKRLGVLWQQVSTDAQGTKAIIDKPTSLTTRIRFPKPGAYKFVLAAVFGSQRVLDTLVIGVQAPPDAPVFIYPTAGDTVYLWNAFYAAPTIVWQGQKKDEPLILDFSKDGGANWSQLYPVLSEKGFNFLSWFPQDTTGRALLRLRKSTGETVATSATFQVRNRPAFFAKTAAGSTGSAQSFGSDIGWDFSSEGRLGNETVSEGSVVRPSSKFGAGTKWPRSKKPRFR